MAPEPLRDADPRQLGAFRLRGRVAQRPEGVVYSARDAAGGEVSVAALSAGATADPVVCDRFAAAVERGVGVPDAPRVVASGRSGAVAWVATEPTGGGAGASLSAAVVASSARGRGPGYAPYWSAGATPAAVRWLWPPRRAALAAAAAAGAGTNRGLAAGVVALVALIVALLLVLYFFLADVNRQVYSTPQQQPSSPSGSSSPSPSPSAEPSPSPEGGQPAPSPRGSSSPAGSPVPSVSVDPEDVEDLPGQQNAPEDLL